MTCREFAKAHNISVVGKLKRTKLKNKKRMSEYTHSHYVLLETLNTKQKKGKTK